MRLHRLVLLELPTRDPQMGDEAIIRHVVDVSQQAKFRASGGRSVPRIRTSAIAPANISLHVRCVICFSAYRTFVVG